MAEKKIDNLKLEPPATTDIDRLAQEARDAIRAARSRLHMEVEALNADRLEFTHVQEQLAQERKALGEEQKTLEAERPKLEALASENKQKLEDIRAAEARTVESQRVLSSKEQELENFRASLDQEKQAHASAVSMLVERESAIEIAETNLAEQRQITEPRFKELERRETEFSARSKEIEAYAAELDGTRKTLLTMQEQLELAQKEVATQREELLRRLGGTSQMPLIAKTPDRNVGQISDLEIESPGKPKPAASPAAEQFRKLRRDAKRRAIGV